MVVAVRFHLVLIYETLLKMIHGIKSYITHMETEGEVGKGVVIRI